MTILNMDTIFEIADFHERGTILLLKITNEFELRQFTDYDALHKKIIELIIQDTNRKNIKLITNDFTNITQGVFVIICVNSSKVLINNYITDLQKRLVSYIDYDNPRTHIKSKIISANFDLSNNSEDKYNNFVKQLYNLQFLIDAYNQPYYQNIHTKDKFNLDVMNHRLFIIKSAFLEKKFKFIYQPIVDTKSKEVLYHECLLRIENQDTDKTLQIGNLIKSAENTGLIVFIDMLAIEQALKELTQNNKLRLSVNISNITILSPNIIDRLYDLIKQYDVQDRLIIEITETILNNNIELTNNFINKLKSLGVKIALDDFGAGFTSIKQLKNLSIDILKIDGVYIKDLNINEYSQFFVSSIIKLTKILGIKTVAEFVDREDIVKSLEKMGIDSMQGNLFPACNEINEA